MVRIDELQGEDERQLGAMSEAHGSSAFP